MRLRTGYCEGGMENTGYGRGRHSFWQLENRGSGKRGRIQMNLNIAVDLKNEHNNGKDHTPDYTSGSHLKWHMVVMVLVVVILRCRGQ